MKKKINSLCFSLLVFLSIPTFAQGPGEPYFPETANGAQNASYLNQSLRWQNPIGTTYNEIFISYDSLKVANMDPSALYISGYPSTAFDSIKINQQLFYPTRYFWCVVEYNSSGFTKGEVRYFTTTIWEIDYAQLDDFSFGFGKWSINNSGGCGWQIGEIGGYTLPLPSTSKVLMADKNLCGNNINATATFQQVNIMKYMDFAWLEFNSDWKTQNPSDYALVQMSKNNGSWVTIWQKTGISDRNNHINLSLFSGNWNPDTIYSVKVRFVTVQNGTDSWWAIDNVSILGNTGLLSHFHPWIINVKPNYSAQLKVILKFGCAVPQDVRIERKNGLPLDPGNYQLLASYYSTYNNTYIDSTIADSSIYTYRVGGEEGFYLDPWIVYSCESTAYAFPIVPVELQSFTAEVIGSDVKLFWSTATETNNQGFEIERSPSLIPSQKEGTSKTPLWGDWGAVGFVPGFGTTTEVHHYSFMDESLQSGEYQYRLKQLDFDGTFEYSNIIEVTVEAPTKFSLEQNYPNPFNPTTHFEFRIADFGFVSFKVYDVLGNEVATLVNEQKSAGTYEIEFNGTELSSGIYFYQIKAGSFTESKKMILLR